MIMPVHYLPLYADTLRSGYIMIIIKTSAMDNLSVID